MTYRETVFLPKTSMPTRATAAMELPFITEWHDLYEKIRAAREGSKPFILHDGPPYANGDIHIGHAVNKIIKDIAVRTQSLLGRQPMFKPGWDCHGLPIEWKVEEQWRRDKRDKNADPEGFRADCRAYALKWVDTQREQFKRLGIMADWDGRFGTYLTLSHESEVAILHAFHRMVEDGKVYRANKPVLWSVIERTALAEAETEEQEHIVPNVWVRFPVHSGPLHDEGADLLVWTTTPWSLPGNVAVAFNPDISYGLYETSSGRLVVADALAEATFNETYWRVRDVPVSDLVGGRGYAPPLGEGFGQCSGFSVCKIIPADFVRANAGTGFVHVGPAHSSEDWAAWRNYAGEDAVFPNPILDNGTYDPDLAIFGGIAVTKGKKLGPANEAIVKHLIDQGTLYRREDRPLTMQHSWRSGGVLITRATPQVFIRIDQEVRDRALAGADQMKFDPASGGNRVKGMVEHRPDWLVSRQRLWGVPVALYVHRQTGEILRDVVGATHQTLMDCGIDEWWSLDTRGLFEAIGRDDWADYDRVEDVLDVWFDSGQVSLLMGGDQADLVIEGSDQARGWFGSSLMCAVLDRWEGRAVPPFKNVITHGFALDQHGKKMSKSQGNVIDPLAVVDQYGADALRIWVASLDWRSDFRVSQESLKNSAEMARKIRNTLRYMVGALHDYQVSEVTETQPFDRYVANKLAPLSDRLAAHIVAHDYGAYLNDLVEYIQFISSVFFDVRKDLLYCGNDAKRDGYRETLATILDALTRFIAPLMPFAAEEVWRARGNTDSVHLQRFPLVAITPHDIGDNDLWERRLEYRSRALAVLEEYRLTFKNPQSARLVVLAPQHVLDDFRGFDFAEFVIVSSVKYQVANDFSIEVYHAEMEKCERCWRYQVTDTGELCDRCEEVLHDTVMG